MSDQAENTPQGSKVEGDVPADAEVLEGADPNGPISSPDAEGRDHHHHDHYRVVCCPYCHAHNRVSAHAHYVHCYHCHRTFHV